MTGAEHYKRAQALLDQVDLIDRAAVIAAAQVHATLALVAATAYPAIVAYSGDESNDCRDWATALS